MSETRIKLNDTILDIASKMSDGNMGAMQAIMEMIQPNSIDPDNILGGISNVMLLDTYGIYGTDIYVLYADICGKDLVKLTAIMRACQLGIFDNDILADACSRQDYSGREMIPIDDLYKKVKEFLPRFNSM